MPVETDKTQIGIRLPSAVVRALDTARGSKTRAEFCRDLIEAGLSATHTNATEHTETVISAIESLQNELAATRQSVALTQRDAAKTLSSIQELHSALATAIVGVLTKIGQAVREDDQRQFSREKAEEFAKRIFFPDLPKENQLS